VINPQWYCSSRYLENQRRLPAPVLFIETESGLPLKDGDKLEELYYIQTESRIDINSYPENLRQEFSPLASEKGVIRAAHVLSPYGNFGGTERVDSDLPYWFEVPLVDVELWQRNYDAVGATLRVLIEGNGDGMISQLFDTFVFACAFVGTRVYSANGELIPPPIPEDPDSPLLDSTMKQYLSDQKFHQAMKELRKMKKSNKS
jgi:hypothetical protein